jgi:arylsulfatase A-like enzyme
MTNRPNIILVLTDDQGYGDLGCHGNPWLKTPHLDTFYGESLRLANYHVGPTCAPTRAGLLTGHFANSTGVWHTIGGRSLLRKDEWSLASALAGDGYRTGIFGKWHLGDSPPYRPQDRGFQRTVVHGGGGIGQTPDHWGNDYFDDTYDADGVPTRFKGYCTEVFFREAAKFIEQSAAAGQPFFCYLAPNAPHFPYNVAHRYADLYRGKVEENRARFYGMITNLDENFGRLRALLRERKLEDNTILVFMTDNGSSCALTYGANGGIVEGFNAGLRGQKSSEYDGGHRTPCFIRWPRPGIGGGRDIDELTSHVDFMPTVLDLCGVKFSPEQFHGVSLRPLLMNETARLPERIVVTDSQRLVQPEKWRHSSAMLGEWRLINGSKLYNLTEDWGQTHDVAAAHPLLVEKLRTGYERWWELVSVKFEETIPLTLTDTWLTSHDWRGDESTCVWNQGQVRRGQLTGGYWEVLAEQGGEYEVSLFRWPEETGYALRDGIDGNDCGYDLSLVQREHEDYYSGGVALPLTAAELLIDGVTAAKKTIAAADDRATLTVTLSAGEHRLEGVFHGADGLRVGAYYARVRLVRTERSNPGCLA